MLKVGITGNIGSGKTTVSKIFEVLGIPVFYADAAAKQVMTHDRQLIKDIKQTFGSEAYLADGMLNRKYIADIVFNNDTELYKLNAIVHPATFRAFDSWLAKVDKRVPYILKEAALLFESDSYKMCDETILVRAPLSIRHQRVMLRDGVSAAQVQSREAKQMMEEEKVKLAGYIIVNDETEAVIPQVLALHNRFLALVKGK